MREYGHDQNQPKVSRDFAALPFCSVSGAVRGLTRSHRAVGGISQRRCRLVVGTEQLRCCLVQLLTFEHLN